MNPRQNVNSSTILPGAHVYDSNHDKVGTVLEVEPQGQYFIAEKGWLFVQDVYIPVDAVSTVNDDGVHLRYSKDELQQRDWTNPPTTTSARPHIKQTAAGNADALAATTGATDQRDIRVPLREEELLVDKTRQQEGNVHLHKDVVAEQQSVTVPVTHEEVHVERVAADANTPVADDAFVERDIDVPVMGEQVTTDKRVRSSDEVVVRKDAVTDQQRVSDTVRKERLNVHGDGTNVQVDGDIHDDTTQTQP